jgi:hypothetical protein
MILNIMIISASVTHTRFHGTHDGSLNYMNESKV